MTASFTDIAAHWARSPIQTLADRQWVRGYPNGTFQPDRPVTRAEFAALLVPRFPAAPKPQAAIAFSDVLRQHWAATAIAHSTERGWIAGYPDGTFRPQEPLLRGQAWVILVNAIAPPDRPTIPALGTLPALYFDDAAQIPAYGQRAIATALVNHWLVNYPDVRQLRPQAPMTRAEVVATLALAFGLAPPELVAYQPQVLPLTAIAGDVALSLTAIQTNALFLAQLQERLTTLGLYDPSSGQRGRYSADLRVALTEFGRIMSLPTMTTQTLDARFYQALDAADPASIRLQVAQDRAAVYQYFLRREAGYNASKLAILDAGIRSSPYAAEVDEAPKRLRSPLLTTTSTPAATPVPPYPAIGQVPKIDPAGLAWLHVDIQQACLCVGTAQDGIWTTAWQGRQAMQVVECWSTTKIIPIFYLVSQANRRRPDRPIDQYQLRDRGMTESYDVMAIARDIVSYDQAIGSSNALAYSLKLLATAADLEAWVRQMTGNLALEFRGRYGEPAQLAAPELVDRITKQVVLTAQASAHTGDNSVSMYDLTRLLTLVGWHSYLAPEARLPGAQWHSLAPTIAALGVDSARYVEAAIAKLGLSSYLKDVVIVSKFGFGRSQIRDRTELVYSALVQFTVSPLSPEQVGRSHQFSFTLLAAKDLNHPDQEARELDARMAAEVTELLRRIVTGDGLLNI